MLDSFMHYSFAMLYRDPGKMHDIFPRAALIEDVSTDQRDRLLDLQADYLARYEQLTNRLIEETMRALYWTRNYSEEQERMKGPNRLRFDRNELNAGVQVQLRTILTPQQVESLGELPDLK